MRKQEVYSATPEQVRWFRLSRSGLLRPFESMEDAAGALMGVQAQILPAAGLSLWNRSADLQSHSQFQETLFLSRTLVKLWGQRGTLHLYPSEDWSLVCGGLADKPSWWERKIIREGGSVDDFRATVAALVQLLHEKKKLTRSDLRASRLPLHERWLSSWGGIFHELVRAGHACHGPSEGGQGTFASRIAWLPELPWCPPTPAQAHREWTLRYLRCYGPIHTADLAYWRGTTQRSARPWLDQMLEELVAVESRGESMWLHRDDLHDLLQEPPPPEQWPLFMLYRFDPLLLAHKDKSWLLDIKDKAKVWRKAGHIEGTILKHGRIVGTWRYQRDARSISITVTPFSALPPATLQFIEQRAEEIAAYFCTPLHRFQLA